MGFIHSHTHTLPGKSIIWDYISRLIRFNLENVAGNPFPDLPVSAVEMGIKLQVYGPKKIVY